MIGVMDRPASASALARAELAGLLRRVGAGDRSALTAVYERTSAKLYGICLRLLRCEAEAQEALQESYLTIWRKAAQYEEARASPITWMALIAHSRAIDLKRRRSMSADNLAMAGEIADDRLDASAQLQEAEEEDRLRHCLDTLEREARTMIRAAFLDGLSYAELAARAGVPLGTMKSRIRRGLQQLKGCMEG